MNEVCERALAVAMTPPPKVLKEPAQCGPDPMTEGSSGSVTASGDSMVSGNSLLDKTTDIDVALFSNVTSAQDTDGEAIGDMSFDMSHLDCVDESGEGDTNVHIVQAASGDVLRLTDQSNSGAAAHVTSSSCQRMAGYDLPLPSPRKNIKRRTKESTRLFSYRESTHVHTGIVDVATPSDLLDSRSPVSGDSPIGPMVLQDLDCDVGLADFPQQEPAWEMSYELICKKERVFELNNMEADVEKLLQESGRDFEIQPTRRESPRDEQMYITYSNSARSSAVTSLSQSESYAAALEVEEVSVYHKRPESALSSQVQPVFASFHSLEPVDHADTISHPFLLIRASEKADQCLRDSGTNVRHSCCDTMRTVMPPVWKLDPVYLSTNNRCKPSKDQLKEECTAFYELEPVKAWIRKSRGSLGVFDVRDMESDNYGIESSVNNFEEHCVEGRCLPASCYDPLIEFPCLADEGTATQRLERKTDKLGPVTIVETYFVSTSDRKERRGPRIARPITKRKPVVIVDKHQPNLVADVQKDQYRALIEVPQKTQTRVLVADHQKQHPSTLDGDPHKHKPEALVGEPRKQQNTNKLQSARDGARKKTSSTLTEKGASTKTEKTLGLSNPDEKYTCKSVLEKVSQSTENSQAHPSILKSPTTLKSTRKSGNHARLQNVEPGGDSKRRTEMAKKERSMEGGKSREGSRAMSRTSDGSLFCHTPRARSVEVRSPQPRVGHPRQSSAVPKLRLKPPATSEVVDTCSNPTCIIPRFPVASKPAESKYKYSSVTVRLPERRYKDPQPVSKLISTCKIDQSGDIKESNHPINEDGAEALIGRRHGLENIGDREFVSDESHELNASSSSFHSYPKMKQKSFIHEVSHFDAIEPKAGSDTCRGKDASSTSAGTLEDIRRQLFCDRSYCEKFKRFFNDALLANTWHFRENTVTIPQLCKVLSQLDSDFAKVSIKKRQKMITDVISENRVDYKTFIVYLTNLPSS